VVITLPVIAIGATTPGRAQPKTFDGTWKGSFEGEPMMAVVKVFARRSRSSRGILLSTAIVTQNLRHSSK